MRPFSRIPANDAPIANAGCVRRLNVSPSKTRLNLRSSNCRAENSCSNSLGPAGRWIKTANARMPSSEARSVHFWHSHYITLSRSKDGGGFIGNGRKEQFVGIRIPSTVKNDFLVDAFEESLPQNGRAA